MLPEWPPGTVTVLATGGGAAHAIPVSAAIRAAPDIALLGLGARRESLPRLPAGPRAALLVVGPGAESPPRLRADPRAALLVLAAGDVAFTAHGRATVLDEVVDGVVAVRLDVERVQDHRQPSFTIEDGVRWHWTDPAAADRDATVRGALQTLMDTLTGP